MSHPLKGRKQTPEHVAKRVAAWKDGTGPQNSAALCLKLSKKNIGRVHDLAVKQRMSAAKKGKRYALGTVRDLEFRQKLSDYWAANKEKHNNFKDGRYAERSSERRSEMSKLPYRIWRESVFKRDNWTCVQCGQRGGKLQADHIKAWAAHPELRYQTENGRTLCSACHKKTDTYCRAPKRNAA